MSLDLNESDPFLIARDAGEEAIDRIVREFCLRTAPPVRVFRQDRTAASYALIVPRWRGERHLTVPALQEADFMFHGNPGTASGTLADFAAECVRESEADHLRLPLLSRAQGERLKRELADRLPGWRIETALSALSPLARNDRPEPGILRKAIARTERDGFILEAGARLEIGELHGLHAEQWGKGNRGETFFQMLDTLLQAGHAELVTARDPSGELFAAQVDLLGSDTRHCYYAIGDTGRAPGCGTAVLGISWRRFAEGGRQRIYSFGRGAERYKYQYASGYRELFELRGFYVPANMTCTVN